MCIKHKAMNNVGYVPLWRKEGSNLLEVHYNLKPLPTIAAVNFEYPDCDAVLKLSSCVDVTKLEVV